MSIRVSDSWRFSALISIAALLLASSTLIVISPQPAAAQSRVAQNWAATLNDPVPAAIPKLVTDAAADRNGGEWSFRHSEHIDSPLTDNYLLNTITAVH